MQSTHIAFIAKQPIPIEFNTIVVQEDGSVARHIPGRPVAFQFAYLGIPFKAHTQTEGDHPVLHLDGEVGPAPYSAESIPARRATHAILRASWSLPHGRLVAWPGGYIRVTGRMPLPRPLTPVALISAVVSILLDLRPYLDLLHEFLPGQVEAATGTGGYVNGDGSGACLWSGPINGRNALEDRSEPKANVGYHSETEDLRSCLE